MLAADGTGRTLNPDAARSESCNQTREPPHTDDDTYHQQETGPAGPVYALHSFRGPASRVLPHSRGITRHHGQTDRRHHLCEKAVQSENVRHSATCSTGGAHRMHRIVRDRPGAPFIELFILALGEPAPTPTRAWP